MYYIELLCPAFLEMNRKQFSSHQELAHLLLPLLKMSASYVSNTSRY